MESSNNNKMLLVLISGAPATGKTSTSAELEKQIPNSKSVDVIYPTGDRMKEFMDAVNSDDQKTFIEITSEMYEKQLSKVKAIADEGVIKVVFLIGVRAHKLHVQNFLKVTDYRTILVRLFCSIETGIERAVGRVDEEKKAGINNVLHADSEAVAHGIRNVHRAMENYGEEDHIVIDAERPLEEVVADLKELIIKNLEV